MKKRTMKILSVAMAALVLTTASSVVLADSVRPVRYAGSRVPVGITPVFDPGIQVEAPYEYVSRNARYIGEKYTLIGNTSTVQQELNRGSHYYAFSKLYSHLTTPYYGEAYTRVKLPTSINRGWNSSQNNALRNGFISLGIFGSLGDYGIDMGIMYDDGGWRPYVFDTCEFNDGDDNSGSYVYDSKYTVPDSRGAVEAVIVATPISETEVQFYVEFKDANGNNIYPANDPFWKIVPIAPGNIFDEGGVPACFYYRFASLVNIDENVDNQNDGTYMLGGKFEGVALYNTTTNQYDDWGMESGLMEKAWKVTPECTSVTWTSNSDTFNIYHTGAVPQP